MKSKRLFYLYTSIWMLAMLLMMLLLWQIAGYARAINYAGIVRGGTQKLVKQELYNNPNDALLVQLDDIIYDLETGKGEYGLIRMQDQTFHEKLDVLQETWGTLKEILYKVRAGEATQAELYLISETHFIQADEMVAALEAASEYQMIMFYHFFAIGFLVSVAVLLTTYLKSQRALRETRIRDTLTPLLSRAGFEEAAARYLRQEKEGDIVLVRFDIDQFKLFNNTYGYKMGDSLLLQLAEAVQAWVAPGTPCARIDADDFVILTSACDDLIETLHKVLQDAVSALKISRYFSGVKFTFGAYALGGEREQIKTILDKATEAHESSKNDPSTFVVWYNQALLQKRSREMMMLNRMNHAIETKEFQLYLQPQVALQTMQVTSAEALVRWKLPDGSFLYPAEFIPLFENKELIGTLDFYMLERVCEYLQQTQGQHLEDFRISVNFSRISLYRPTFYNDFIEILMHYKVPCHKIEIEVTESSFAQIDTKIIALLQQLKDAGVSIAMDDFGAGYSTLNELSYLPLNIVKLDRQFLLEREQNPKMEHVMRYMVELSHILNMRVICEGLERAADIAFLQEIGCEYAQGYYFERPCPSSDFLKTVEKLR